MNPTPRTHEAIERWYQGKSNIFDEMATLEIELAQSKKELARLKSLAAKPCEAVAFPEIKPENGQHVLWLWAEACQVTSGDFYNNTPRDAAKNFEPISDTLPTHFLPWSKVTWWPQL